MELILLENIINLGNIGDKVSVKNGYGRNSIPSLRSDLSEIAPWSAKFEKSDTALGGKALEIETQL